MKNILIAPNSFKGTADAVEVSELFKKHLDKSIFNIIQKPISDGGDGFLEVCRLHFGLEILNYSIPAPYDETYIDCNVGLDNKSKTLFIESAEVLGLKKIPKDKRNPLLLSSKGMGYLLQLIIKDIDELRFEADNILIGIGGTGTMDMGLGMCSQFGLKLFNFDGTQIEVLPENYGEVAEVEFNKPDLPFTIEMILDVENPLLGKEGGVIFGRQKGAANKDIQIIEFGWNKVVTVLKNNGLLSSPKELSGAGGGLPVGFGLLSHSTKRKQAREFISENLNLTKIDSDLDMVITGEGSFDEQSLMGKGVSVIINLFEEKNIPVILCCGKIDSKISEQFSMNVFPMELRTYINDPINNFEDAIKIACDEISGMTDILTKFS